MFIKQLVNLEKVRTENLKFRTYLQDRVMDGWSVTQWWVDECLQRQIAKKIFKSKIEAGAVKAQTGH